GDELTIGNYRYQVRWEAVLESPVSPRPAGPGRRPTAVDDEQLEACEEPVPLDDPEAAAEAAGGPHTAPPASPVPGAAPAPRGTPPPNPPRRPHPPRGHQAGPRQRPLPLGPRPAQAGAVPRRRQRRKTISSLPRSAGTRSTWTARCPPAR